MLHTYTKKTIVLLAWLTILIVSFTIIPNLMLAARADLSDSNIGVSGSAQNGSWKADGTKITASSTGGYRSNKTTTIEIFNNSGSAAILSFDYSITLTHGSRGDSSADIAGTSFSSNASDHFSQLVDKGSLIILSITAGGRTLVGSAGSASLSITNIQLTKNEIVSVSFTESDVPYTVSYYTDTETVATPVSVTDSKVILTGEKSMGFTITTSVSNYHFVGVNSTVDNVTSFIPAVDSQFKPDSGAILTPVFLYSTESTAPFQVNGVGYWTWETAFNAAGDGGTVVMQNDYTLPTAGDVDVLTRNGLIGNGQYVTFSYASDGATVTGVTYSMPSNATLLLPYAAGANTVATSTAVDTTGNCNSTYIASATSTVEGGWDSTWEYANVDFISDHTHGDSPASGGYDANVPTNILMPKKVVTYTLTIPSGTTVNVDSGGKFVIGGTIASGHAKTAGIVGGTAGAHSNVQLDGTLNVSGILSSCGYVLGGGTMNVNSGGTVYQPFTLMDHRGGQYASISKDNESFPFNRYSMQNIQSKIHMVSGAVMKGYVDIYTQTTTALNGLVTVKERHNVSCQTIIGASGALINLTSGALDISYDPSRYANDTAHNSTGLYDRVGTTTLDFSGDASLGNLTVDINVAGTPYSLDTSTDYFPVPYNYIINLNSGTFTVGKNLKLLPGSVMNVGTNATLNVKANLAVMDGFRDHGARASSANESTWSVYHYPSSSVLQASPISGTGAANLIVKGGTVNITGTFGGIIQTNGSGTVNMNGTSTLELGIGSPSANTIMGFISTAVCGRTVRTLNAKLFRTDGGQITMQSGKSYVAAGTGTNTIEKYTYTLYNSSSDTSSTTSLTATLNATLTGTWKCADTSHEWGEGVVTTEPTCTTAGVKTYTCSGCGHSYTESIGFLFYAANVRLGNNLDMMFAFSKEAVKDWTGYYVEVVRTRADGTMDDSVKYDTSTWTTNGEYYVVTYSGIAAKEMCDTLALTIYDGDENAVSSTWTDSIELYARRMIAKDSVSTNLKTALVDMLNYGAACQTYFGYGTDKLVNTDLTGGTSTNPEVADKYAEVREEEGSTWAASLLVVKSNIQYKLAFNNMSEDMYAVYSFTGHKGNTVTSEKIYLEDMEVVDTYPFLLIQELVVADARCPITVTVYDADGVKFDTWQESIEAYVCRMQDSNPVYMAFMKFADSAYTYLHNK